MPWSSPPAGLPAPSARPAAVIAHGSGSTADFVQRAFGPALQAAGYELVTWDDRTGDVAVVTNRLADLAARSRARIIGGISLGAHAAAWAAAGRADLDGVLLALPAWTGPPGATAALSGLAAESLSREGLDRVLGRFAAGGWVGGELVRAWSAYGQQRVVAALRQAAASPAPSAEDLGRVAAPAGVVAFVDDPLHPVGVADEWCRALPRTAMRRLRLVDAESDRGAIGRAVVDAWQAATGPSR